MFAQFGPTRAGGCVYASARPAIRERINTGKLAGNDHAEQNGRVIRSALASGGDRQTKMRTVGGKVSMILPRPGAEPIDPDQSSAAAGSVVRCSRRSRSRRAPPEAPAWPTNFHEDRLSTGIWSARRTITTTPGPPGRTTQPPLPPGKRTDVDLAATAELRSAQSTLLPRTQQPLPVLRSSRHVVPPRPSSPAEEAIQDGLRRVLT